MITRIMIVWVHLSDFFCFVVKLERRRRGKKKKMSNMHIPFNKNQSKVQSNFIWELCISSEKIVPGPIYQLTVDDNVYLFGVHLVHILDDKNLYSHYRKKNETNTWTLSFNLLDHIASNNKYWIEKEFVSNTIFIKLDKSFLDYIDKYHPHLFQDHSPLPFRSINNSSVKFRPVKVDLKNAPFPIVIQSIAYNDSQKNHFFLSVKQLSMLIYNQPEPKYLTQRLAMCKNINLIQCEDLADHFESKIFSYTPSNKHPDYNFIKFDNDNDVPSLIQSLMQLVPPDMLPSN